MAQTPTIVVMEPHAVPEGGLAPFLHAGTEIGVEPERLEQRVRRAHRLIYLFIGERLIGVSAIKVPAPSYRERVFREAGVPDRLEDHPLEFGWLYVLPGERGEGHAGRLITAGREAAPASGLFATVRAGDGPALKRTFARHGYRALGQDFASSLGDHRLALLAAPPLEAAGSHA